jgi:uncharacterized protein YktB (UPF0637 family)
MNFEIKPLLEKNFTEEYAKTLLVLKLKPFRIQFADHERTTIVNPNTKLIAFYQTTRHGFI